MASETKDSSASSRITDVIGRLEKAYPRSRCALHFESPFQLLVATVLSAQTTDLKVNEVTRELFDEFPDAETMAAADESEIAEHIRSIGLWRNKAKFLSGLSRKLVEEFDGKVPRTVKELTTLPGVARKTATAVLGTAFDLDAGITVDTHMLRINRRLGLSEETNAVKMGSELEEIIPRKHWNRYTHLIIDHGRLVCTARKPRCGVCVLDDLCPSACDPEIGYRPENDEKEPASAKGLSWRVNPDA